MKIFRFFSNNIKDQSTFYNNMSIVTIPDTALLIQKRPFFIPDFTNHCMVQLCACVRINRLGRSIHEHFAERYYDANKIAIGTHFVARDLLNKLVEQHFPWDKAVGFDNAVVVAESPCNMTEGENETCMTIGDRTYKTTISKNELLPIINHQIAHISLFYTLKQGDILIFPLKLQEQQVYIDEHVALSINNETILQFNIK